jgi:hypothetical protein
VILCSWQKFRCILYLGFCDRQTQLLAWQLTWAVLLQALQVSQLNTSALHGQGPHQSARSRNQPISEFESRKLNRYAPDADYGQSRVRVQQDLDRRHAHGMSAAEKLPWLLALVTRASHTHMRSQAGADIRLNKSVHTYVCICSGDRISATTI